MRIALHQPDPAVLRRAARLLLEGELVVAPSDTVYGLLALPRSERARSALAEVKGRPGPFLVLVSSWEEARSWATEAGDDTWRRLRRVWPGPVTVILPTRPDMPGAENGTIGLRMPRSVFLARLLEETGEPLFSTSANLPGAPAPVGVGDLDPRITAAAALVLDGGRAESAEPSTVVNLCGERPRVVRPGRGDPAPLLDPARPSS